MFNRTCSLYEIPDRHESPEHLMWNSKRLDDKYKSPCRRSSSNNSNYIRKGKILMRRECCRFDSQLGESII